jgi:hypothetical protein
MNIRNFLIATASATTCMLAASTHATAADVSWDYKNYAGAGCLAQLAADTPLLDRGTNMIQNSGGPRDRPVRVMCPVVRDNVLPSELIDASVTVSPDVECTFFSADMAGNIVAAVPTSSYEDYSWNVRKYYFVLKQDQVPFDGTFAIRCTLNPGQAVYGYNVGELGTST